MGRAEDSTMEEVMFSTRAAGAESDRAAETGAEAEAASPAGAAQPVSSSADNSADSIFRIVRPLSRSCRSRLPENGPSASGSHSLV